MSNKISLQEILTNKLYEGYLWWSDEDKPEIFQNEILTSKVHKLWPAESNNPFIIEGNLWDKKDQTSYLIRFIDGKYLVYKFDLKGVDPEAITELEYLPHRMPEVEKLKFKEVWIEQPDLNCLNFDVLKPAYTAFVGFIKNKEVKK